MGNRKQYIGKVVSNKMDKTIVVVLERLMMHSLYKKSVRMTKRVKSHDEKNECSLGDTVLIEESRPVSRTKAWKVARLVERGAKV